MTPRSDKHHRTTHGMKGTSEYNAWANMLQRCGNPNHPDYQEYGGRGIYVCDRWRESFETFYADMGPRPSDQHTLERQDVNAGYYPGNCLWATWDVQGSNKRNSVFYTVDGETYTQSQLARKVGMSVQTLAARLKSGLSVEEAIARPMSTSGRKRKPK